MTDSELLKEKIKKSGYKMKYVAAMLGISYYGFFKKLTNDNEFKASEIQKLCELLGIEGEDKERIFFANNVDKKSTK